MRNMLKTIGRHLADGEALVMVTVTASSGAVPRGTGARMLVGKSGRICGTIGGGAVEYRCQQTALRALSNRASIQQGFSLNRDDVENLGMICGGAVNVFFHYLPAQDAETLALTVEAERLFKAGVALWLVSDLENGGAMSLYTEKEGVFGPAVPQWVLSQLSRQPKLVAQKDRSYCIEQIHSPGRVCIFGCGHVSQQLEPLLTHVGFRCVVLDDRPEFARKELFPTAEAVMQIDFAKIGESISIGPEDYVCIMTRGHAFDTVIQAQVLKCQPCYIGVIGSRKKAAAVRQVLRTDYGISDEELDCVTTPIGLDIGARTPEEIAVSIAAQLIQERAKRNEM